ncbi:MAG: hypothetical protein MMC33_003389 [Icmadophila ericetorum]|nr:hypothetical protein [Icmadophila ericetorum]
MSTAQSSKASPMQRRSRKSIAHVPTSVLSEDRENKENSMDVDKIQNAVGRKPRSKSLGPGGLRALQEAAGNRQKTLPAVKSILKPTIPLSPPKQIPPHHRNKRSSPTKGGPLSPMKDQNDGLLVNLSIPDDKVGQVGTESLQNPFEMLPVAEAASISDVRISVRTEEEQQAAVREREKQDILDRRNARRKSLANRRVSFAPEATLHTWNVVELPEDATSSSEATNSTRRASAASTHIGTPFRTPQPKAPGFEMSEPPSTPPEQVEEAQATTSPVPQRELHQKKRRRSSGIPPMNFNNPKDFSSSPSSSILSDDTVNQTFEMIGEGAGSSDSSDGDSVESESMTVAEGDDTTSHSLASVHSTGRSSTSSSGRLDAALRLEAQQAGTQANQYDEHEDVTMEIADEEITNAFKPWAKRGSKGPNGLDDLSSRLDQENLNPFSPAFKANLATNNLYEEDAEKPMDITQAVGSILPSAYHTQHSQPKYTSSGSPQERKTRASRLSLSDESMLADETMDLTLAIGGIQQSQPGHISSNQERFEEDDDLSMEFTSVIGGVIDRNSHMLHQNQSGDLEPQSQQQFQAQHQSIRKEPTNYEELMDVTTAFDRILESITEHTEPDEDRTYAMDMTTAIGEILPRSLKTDDLSTAKKLMILETESGTLTKSPLRNESVGKVSNRDKNLAQGSIVKPLSTLSRTGSPSIGQVQSRSSARINKPTGHLETLKSNSRQSTPVKKPSTPSKQITPKPLRPTTPGKTPPSKNVSLRTGSPKKIFKAKIKELNITPRSTASASKLNLSNDLNSTFPSIVLTPQPLRRISGTGIDKEGLGSPRVAAILDRRGSIGEHARSFTPQNPPQFNVRFEDPKFIEWDIENELVEEQCRESGQGFLLTGSDAEEEKDLTANLKDMIQSMSPKKNKLRGRKSLHVGAARGLLGKRPIELDQDEEDEHTPKRLKGQERSPVKNVKLPGPPSKLETIGRRTKTPDFGDAELSSNVTETLTSLEAFTPSTSLVKMSKAKDVGSDMSQVSNPSEDVNSQPLAPNQEAPEPTDTADRIQLQDFLNMTSIRFIELTSTKRRHTVAQHSNADDSIRLDSQMRNGGNIDNNVPALESYIVASACTSPMLEMYEHSCHELKKYIAEGRGVVREIEDATFEENPQLFREYMTATPELRIIMDNQFKNVKTHARLLSKEQWYQWRMQLLDGLKEGLLRNSEGLSKDEKVLAQQERLLNPIIPGLVKEHEALESEAKMLQAQADELASCDQEELSQTRNQLLGVDMELEAKKKKLAILEQEQKDLDDAISQKLQRKHQCLEEIKEAEKVREECRGWSGSEIASLKANVDTLEEKYGWNIVAASGNAFTFSYRRILHLFLAPSSFLSKDQTTPTNPENSPISLVYVADTHEYRPIPLTTEKRFFLQIMRARLQCLQQARCSLKSVLDFVSSNWDQACLIAEEIRAVNTLHIAQPIIQSDEVLAVKAMILLREKRLRVEVCFRVTVGGSAPLEMKTDVDVQAYVIYGGGIDKERMSEFLRKRVVGSVERVAWGRAVGELERKLVSGKGK